MALSKSLVLAGSAILLFILYFFVTFALKLPYNVYGAIHIIIALLVLMLLSKVEARESIARTGFILSLVIGIPILIINFLFYNAYRNLIAAGAIPAMHIPNALIYFAVFIVLFNIPFLLYSRTSPGKTALFSILLIGLVLISLTAYSIFRLGCISFTCTEKGCSCRYVTLSDGICPVCSDVCAQHRRVEDTTNPTISNTPIALKKTPEGGFEIVGGKTRCYCYCK